MTKPLSVLIVEDCEDDALLLVQHLKREGFDLYYQRLDTAGAMRTALAKSKWDLVLCDYSMPEFGPLAALEDVRATASHTPLIVVSGAVSEEKLVELMRAGAQDIIPKNNLVRLAPAIERGLKDAAVRRERENAETLLREAIESISEGFALFDADDRLVICNAMYRHLYERSADAIIPGARFEEIIRAGAERGLYAAAEGRVEEWVAERLEQHRNPVGAIEQELANDRWLLIAERQIHGGGTAGIRTDITALKKAEESLRDSEALLRLIADNLPALIAYVDIEQRYRFINRTGALWYARAEEEIVGRSVAEVLSEADYAKVEQHLDRAATGTSEMFDATVTYPDGVTREIQGIYVPDRDGEGVVRGFVAMAIDATERKKTEAQLAQAQKMDAVGQLTGGVAHDFNNLLTIILGNAKLLQRRVADDVALAKQTGVIMEAARRGVDLTKRLLSFSRKDTLVPTVVDAVALVQGMLNLLGRTLGETIKVEADLAAEPVLIYVDSNQFENALLNLATNARDAMPKGGTLRITLQDAPATQGAVAAVNGPPLDQSVVLSVADTGTGIPARDLERIFEPFFTTKEVGKGTGLGLSMVFGFAKQSGGSLRVESAEGRGTTFRLHLPKATAAQCAPVQNGASATGHQDANGQATILVVEDEPDVRAIAVAILEDLGYRVIEAENGPDALAKLDKQPTIDLLFTDMIMPGGMTGHELAENAKARWPRLKLLYTSGHTDDALGLGCKDVRLVRKPYDEVVLAEGVRQALAGEAA